MATTTRKRPAVRHRAPAKDDAPRPPVRHMTVIAQDPSVRHKGRILMAKVALPAEDLIPGPMGYRVQIVDYDSTRRRFHGAHQLPESYDAEPVHWRKGDRRLVRDFRFHAQNLYALVMKTLARFEFALAAAWAGRSATIESRSRRMGCSTRTRSTAWFRRATGYFKGLSGALVFTGLSHDVVAQRRRALERLRERTGAVERHQARFTRV